MKKRIYLSIIILLSASQFALADIAPDPTIAKGIIPAHPVDVQMVSEVVRARLTLDSSYVECTFHMHDLGKQTDLEVGFPVMNYYMWMNDKVSPIDQNKFEVLINGKAINRLNTYIPDSLRKMISEGKKQNWGYGSEMEMLFRNYASSDKPWYTWKMHFKKNEYLTILVRYVLPNGYTKSNMYFDYLLSTGAGWKGVIEDAKVIVDIGSIPHEQVLKMSPQTYYRMSHGIIAWHFRKIKPTPQSDILVEYERHKGDFNIYETRKDSISPTYIDGKRSKHSSINFDNVGSYHIKETANGIEFIIFTKGYILNRFKELIKQADPEFWQQMSDLSIDALEKSDIQINGNHQSTDKLFEKLNKIDSANAVTGKIVKAPKSKIKIIIVTAHPIPSDDGVFQHNLD